MAEFYSYEDVAKMLHCATKTIRNLAYRGSIPMPARSLVGPRYTQDQLDEVLEKVMHGKSAPPPVKRGRGRPRIATQRRNR
jgi:hypothetical protein